MRAVLCALLLSAPPSPQRGAGVEQLHAEAKAAEARGDLAGAVSRYEAILAAAPGLGAAYNNLGAFHLRHGEYAKAAAVLEKGLKVDPSMASAAALLGVCLDKMGDHAAARRRLEAALRAQPKDDNARLVLAQTLLKLEEPEAAADHLRQLARRRPDDQEVWYLLGTVYMKLSQRALARLHEIDPESVLVRQINGELMESLKNYDGALVEYRKAVEMAPQRPGTHYRLGNLYWTTAQWDAAAAEFQAELRNDPGNCVAQWKLGNILVEQSLDPARAIAEIDKALAVCPALPQARVDRARAALKLGRHQEALQDLLVAEKASPGEPSVHFFMAQALRGLGRAQEAAARMQIFSRLRESERAATARRAGEARDAAPPPPR